MRLGAYTAALKPGSHVAQIYGTTTIEERHRHRYEVDAKYIESLETVSYTHLDVYKRQLLLYYIDNRQHVAVGLCNRLA